MKNMIAAKRLECALDNPLSPTIATLHLPEMEFSTVDCEKEGMTFTLKPSQKINIEIDHQEESKTSFIQTKLFSLGRADSTLFLELEDPTLGLSFKVGMNQDGQVKNVSANWSRAS